MVSSNKMSLLLDCGVQGALASRVSSRWIKLRSTHSFIALAKTGIPEGGRRVPCIHDEEQLQ
jgi:hypothetical protein